MNPCNEVIPPPFAGTFAIVDASCTAPSIILDEELRLPPFDATGLGSVFVEFYSKFEWDDSVPNNKGDLDVSTNGGATWTNVLRLENGDDGVPTPVVKSINITPYIAANPANVLVRLHYYGMSPPAANLRAAAAAGGKVSWAVDFGVYSYAITPESQSFTASGGTGEITVATSPAIPSPQGEWTAVSNAPWITITSEVPRRGNGSVTFSVAPNPGAARNGTITVSGRTFTVMQAAGCATITVNPATLPAGTLGTVYNQMLTASPSGSYTFVVTAGSLPPGLSLSSSGAITGTPSQLGSFSFTVTASNSTCSGTRSYTITTGCATITLASLGNAMAGATYSGSVAASPSGAYNYSVVAGSLPSGLTLNATTGAITGSPAVTGTYNFSIKAQAANGCSGTRSYTFTVGCPTISISPNTLPNGTAGTSYSQTLSATPATGSYSFAVSSGALPPGLILNVTGILSGTPTANGIYNFSVTATGFGTCTSAPKAYSIQIGSSGCPTITLPNIAATGTVGHLYNQSVNASPAGSYTYLITSGALPPGVTFYSGAALLYGYPTTPGTYTFAVKATNSNGCMTARTYTVVIG